MAFTVGYLQPAAVAIPTAATLQIVYNQPLAGASFPSYNLATGFFKAPAAGLYLFSIDAAAAFTAYQNATFTLVRNGIALSSASLPGTTGQTASTAWSLLLGLGAGDLVSVQCSCSAAASASLPATAYPNFLQSLSVVSLF